MEMLQLAEGLDFQKIYRPRIYVIANNDHLSLEKVHEFENRKTGDKSNKYVTYAYFKYILFFYIIIYKLTN